MVATQKANEAKKKIPLCGLVSQTESIWGV